LFASSFIAINFAEIEARANEILRNALVALGTTVSFFFGIHAGDHSVTVAHREAQEKQTSKKSSLGSSEAVVPAGPAKVIKKRRGRGGGRSVSKR
jgi:hypothetical protein